MWTPGTLLSDSTIQQPLAYIANNTTYHVTTIDKMGCAHRDSTSITISIRDPKLSPADTTICDLGKVQLHASGGTTYNWIASDPATLSCTNCPDPIISTSQTAVYQVVISDQYNCADTLSSIIRVNPRPIVIASPNDTTVKYGTTIQLLASGAYLYSWYPAGYLTDPSISTPKATITRPIVFILTGIDENGCRNTDSVRVNVDYNDAIFIPTAFSPNGDGKNDLFKIGSISFQKLLEFRVFNRWGQEVFTTTDVKQGWDGKWRGVVQDAAVYHYVIRVAYPDGKVNTYKGDLTLIK
jgi:gliding motility-associated-like protein